MRTSPCRIRRLRKHPNTAFDPCGPRIVRAPVPSLQAQRVDGCQGLGDRAQRHGEHRSDGRRRRRNGLRPSRRLGVQMLGLGERLRLDPVRSHPRQCAWRAHDRIGRHGVLVVLGQGVTAFAASTGAPLWTSGDAPGLRGDAIAANGVIYCGGSCLGSSWARSSP